jgi:hypothetical protein
MFRYQTARLIPNGGGTVFSPPLDKHGEIHYIHNKRFDIDFVKYRKDQIGFFCSVCRLYFALVVACARIERRGSFYGTCSV